MNKVLGFWLRYVGGVLAVLVCVYGIIALASVLLPPNLLAHLVFVIVGFLVSIVGLIKVIRFARYDPLWITILTAACLALLASIICLMLAILMGIMTTIEAFLVVPVVCFGLGGFVALRWGPA